MGGVPALETGPAFRDAPAQERGITGERVGPVPLSQGDLVTLLQSVQRGTQGHL